MLVKKDSRQRGFSLVELMIALTLGLVVMGSVLFVVTSTLASHVANLKATRLNQELRATMMMLTRDLRRAGHWGSALEVVRASSAAELTLSAVSGNGVIATSSNPDTFASFKTKLVGRTLKQVGVNGGVGLAVIQAAEDSLLTLDISNPFPSVNVPANTWTILNSFAEITLVADRNEDGEPDDGCLLFSYDSNNNGLLENNERYGFRLDLNEAEKVIKMRQAGADCMEGGWEKLTDENSIKITELRIEDLSSSIPSAGGYEVGLRKFRVTLTGHLKEDASVERTMQSTVKIRNNQIL